MSNPIIKPYGFVQPSLTNGELNDAILRRFLQNVVAGIVGKIEPENIRPRWQHEPPQEPDFETDWCAVGDYDQDPDTFAAEIHSSTTDPPSNTVYRNTVIDCLASFYGPNAEGNAQLLIQGLGLAQNREVFFLNGFGLVDTGKAKQAPAQVHDRWLWGVDVPFSLRRQQIYRYAIPEIEKVIGTIVTDAGLTVPYTVQEE